MRVFEFAHIAIELLEYVLEGVDDPIDFMNPFGVSLFSLLVWTFDS